MATIQHDEIVRQREIEELERLRQIPAPGEEGAALPLATLTISRNASDDVQVRAMSVWLDGEPLGRLRYGDSVTRTITQGHHRLKARNTIVSSALDFDAGPGDHVRVRASNAMTIGGRWMMLLIGWVILKVRLERES